MATRRAIANGNWSATGTWNGNTVPTDGDTVYANGFSVTLDVDVNIGGANNPIVNTGSLVSGQWYEIVNVGGQNWTTLGAASNSVGTVFQSTGTGTAGNLGTARALATLTTATNTAAGATTGGGVFTMSTVRAMTADLRAGTTTCLNVTGQTSITLSGNRIIGGSVVGAIAFNYSGSGTLSFNNGCILNGGTSPALVLNSGNAVINSGVINGGTQSTGITNTSNGSITINNSSISGGGSNGVAINNNTNSGSIVVSGSTLIGGANGATAITNTLTGSVSISNSTITASNNTTGPAISNAAAGTLSVTSSDMIASAFVSAIIGTNTSAIVNLSGNFYDHWQGIPAVYVSKFKLGIAPTLAQHRFALAGTTDSYFTMYGADNGAFGNPIAANVRSGIVYGGGNLTGSCAVPAAGSVSLGVPVDATTGTAVLTPEAVWGHASRTITGGTVDTLTNAPASVTPSDIWSHATRTITGGTVTTLTNAPTVPSASAIASQVRTELGTELGRIDAAISTRATPANIPTADITAIKNKTDLLNTTRLAQVSTTEIVGNLLAQANS